jgi:hypothetical protein
MEVLTTHEGENFTHRSLWRVIIRQIENAEARRPGSLYDDLAAMVFTLHAFEAYLNFLGVKLAPDLWENERNFFRNEPYRGFEGKVWKVFELCQLAEPDRLVRPYSTIWALKDLRDLIAHGKVEAFSQTYVHSAGVEPPFFRGPFDALVSHTKALEAKEDTHSVARTLHAAAQSVAAKSYISDLWFGDDPFEGPLGHASGFSRVIPPPPPGTIA